MPNDFMNRTSRPDDELRKRIAQARHEKLYNNPSTQKLRAELAGPKTTSPESIMANRHADERGELQKKQHQDSQSQLRRQESERNKLLQTSHSMPAGFNDKAERERSDLQAEHRRQREQMDRRHMTEKDKLRG